MNTQTPLPETGIRLKALLPYNLHRTKIVYPVDNSVPHLLWCILVALRTAEEDKPFSSEKTRRRFISDWLNMARHKPNFQGMASEFTTLRELLEKTDRSTCVTDTLNTLLEQAYAAEQCDLFRFRTALNTLLELGWQHTVCRFPENITTELMARRKGSRRHIMQLTRTENAFHPVGYMVKPITFQLIYSKNDAQNIAPENTFHNQGFQVIYAKGELNLTKERIIRTLHIGLPSLPDDEWNPPQSDIWQPDYSPASKVYH